MKNHVSGIIAISPILLFATIVVFYYSLSRVPHSPGFWITAACLGLAAFPVMWHYWHNPSSSFFTFIVMVPLMIAFISRTLFLPRAYNDSGWAFVQFLAIYYFVFVGLVFAFQKRLRAFFHSDTENV